MNLHCLWPIAAFLVPTILGVIIFQLDSFDPAPYPAEELTQRKPEAVAPNRMLYGSEKIGEGQVRGPEDIAYDPKTGVIYTGCEDGWVKRVTVNESSAADSAVEDWVNTGGRPLGLAIGLHGELLVADAQIGLLNVTAEGRVEVLAEEAEGVKFKLMDAVAVAEDGVVYFTDASWKYSVKDFVWDFLEGRPYGRLLSYDPNTKMTKVLVKDLFFPNGVALCPDQDFIVFCETPLRKCKRLFIKGERKGSIDVFIENLPGMPDNVHYDGEGFFWIALVTEHNLGMELTQKLPMVRKVMGVMEKYGMRPKMEKNGGVFTVDLGGNPVAHYYSRNSLSITTGIGIGDRLYCGFLASDFILTFNLTQHPAAQTMM